MKKALTFLLILCLALLIAGIYGIAHDQFTYTISSEYYTKFKFHQFGLTDNNNEAHLNNPRLAVSIVGIMATWWMGIPIGIILGLAGLRLPWKIMLFSTAKAFLITVILAFVIGLIGLAYGYFFLSQEPKSNFSKWFIPDNLIHFRNFISVGSMHNFSYTGGIIGVFFGAVYLILQPINRENKLEA